MTDPAPEQQVLVETDQQAHEAWQQAYKAERQAYCACLTVGLRWSGEKWVTNGGGER